MIRTFILVAGLALMEQGSSAQLLLACGSETNSELLSARTGKDPTRGGDSLARPHSALSCARPPRHRLSSWPSSLLSSSSS